MRRIATLLVAALVLSVCSPPSVETTGRTRLVFKHQPLWGDPAAFRALLADFERTHPDVDLVSELLPSASDLLHQFFLTALEGGAQDFHVFVVDVIWAPEFARAGWIADLSDRFSPERIRDEFLPGPAEAVIYEGRTIAVPWYVDVGLLYYRTDLVPHAPRTYDELRRFARDAMQRDAALAGFVWQGRQYEGLNCNVFESLWGHGGEALSDGRLLLETPRMESALEYLRGLVRDGISPADVTTYAEEETRRAFQSGGAVFMRNWPYAWAQLQSEDSPVRGRVAVADLPSESGEPGPGALGGWQLAMNAHTPPSHREAAMDLIEFLTSHEASLRLAIGHARNPARRALYDDPRLKEGAPFIASLGPMLERARPRPVTPYYNLVSDVLQSEFSAAVAGIRAPAKAMERAQRWSDRLMRE